jgi:ubiquinone/menaquinone biosynthesis C-methylase UbiE
MRSKHADYYNHDNIAVNYDESIQRTDDPIRQGYQEVLDWVIEHADIDASQSVLELGSGTGNLTARIGACKRIVCVDISTKWTFSPPKK